MPIDPLRQHRAPLILAGTVAMVPLWLWLGAWLREDVSGWSALAAHYAADGRVLTDSQGTATVALKQPGRLRHEYSYDSGRTFIEVGIEDEGFWLRSIEFTPKPALYIPWTSVRRCQFTTASVADSDVEISINLQPFIDACQAQVRARGP